MSSSKVWFDYKGSEHYWKTVPLRCVKKALFSRNGVVQGITQMIVNAVVYDFNKTAQGGAVIVAGDYSSCGFIAPDDRLPYDDYLTMTLGQVMNDMEEVLTKKPIPSWDNFMAWLGLNYEAIGDATLNMSSCQLQTIDGGTSISMGIVDFAKVKNFVTFMEQVEIKAPAALRKPLTMFQLDDYVFGFALHMTSSPDEDGNTATLHVGFMFRQ